MSQKYSAEAVAIIKECEVEAERLLQKNKLLLLKIADYLTTHSRMEEQMIADYVRRFAVESWIENGFIKKDNYYQFNTILQGQLSELENKDFSSVVERMVAVASEEVVM